MATVMILVVDGKEDGFKVEIKVYRLRKYITKEEKWASEQETRKEWRVKKKKYE